MNIEKPKPPELVPHPEETDEQDTGQPKDKPMTFGELMKKLERRGIITPKETDIITEGQEVTDEAKRLPE